MSGAHGVDQDQTWLGQSDAGQQDSLVPPGPGSFSQALLQAGGNPKSWPSGSCSPSANNDWVDRLVPFIFEQNIWPHSLIISVIATTPANFSRSLFFFLSSWCSTPQIRPGSSRRAAFISVRGIARRKNCRSLLLPLGRGLSLQQPQELPKFFLEQARIDRSQQCILDSHRLCRGR